MTRFQKEISGELGSWWQKHAKEEVARLVEEVKTEATVDEDGAIKWNSNGHYLPADCCEKLAWARYEFSQHATQIKRDAQESEFIAQYKANAKPPSEEELAEMRSVWGPGTTVVDVISGKEITL